MNKYRTFLVLLALPLSPLAAAGTNPCLDLPAGNMHCSIVVGLHPYVLPGTQPNTNADANPAPPPVAATTDPSARGVITAAEITRVGGLQHTVISLSNGKKTEAWTMLASGMTILEANEGADSFYEFRKGSLMRNHFFPLILDLDKASLGWIDRQHSRGQVVFEDQPALHFQKPVTINDATPARNVLYQAWTDPKTLTLLALDDGDSLYKITFTPVPPNKTLVIPPRFQAELLHYEAAYGRPVHL